MYIVQISPSAVNYFPYYDQKSQSFTAYSQLLNCSSALQKSNFLSSSQFHIKCIQSNYGFSINLQSFANPPWILRVKLNFLHFTEHPQQRELQTKVTPHLHLCSPIGFKLYFLLPMYNSNFSALLLVQLIRTY